MRSKCSSSAEAHSLPPHAILLKTNVTALLILSVTDITQLKQSEAVKIGSPRIKSIIIV